MKRFFSAMVLFAALATLVSSTAVSQPPPAKEGKMPPGKEGKGGKGGPGGDRGGKGGPGGERGGPPRFELGQILPPFVMEELELTPEQTKEIAAMQKDLKAKLEKLLTPEQLKKLETARPRGPGGEGGRGPGGRGPGGEGPEGNRPPRGERPTTPPPSQE